MNEMIFFCNPLEDKVPRIYHSEWKVFLYFAQLQPQLRLGLQSLGLAQKDSLLLLMI
jgi:hypothetical protein